MAETNKELDIFESTTKFFRFLKRYYIIILSVMLLGAIISIFISKNQKDYYKTELYLTNKLISPEDINYLSLDLGKYVKHGQTDSLAKLLETNTTNIENLKAINYRILNDSVFMLNIQSYSDKDLELTKSLLLSYYNNSIVAKANLQTKKEVLSLYNDSLQSYIDNSIDSNEFYFSICEKQIEINNKIENLQAVSIIDSAITKKIEKSYLKNLIAWIFGGFFIGLLVAGLKYHAKDSRGSNN